MFRKALVFLLVFSWVVFSGFDLSEDFDFRIQGRIYNLLNAQPAHVNVVNDIFESGDRTKLCHAELLIKMAAVQLSADAVLVFEKAFKLHKLHRIFLI